MQKQLTAKNKSSDGEEKRAYHLQDLNGDDDKL
ncbi:MAG: hypothetical protein ACI8SJ_001355 [Shewanella sp.]|jgi:hypothetical protein